MKPSLFLKNASHKVILAQFIYLMNLFLPFLPSLATSAELTNVKIIGGYGAECSETSPSLGNSLQPLITNVASSQKTGTTLKAEFEIQFVECTKNKWNKSKSIQTEFEQSITDELGQVQKEKITFSKFRIQIQNTEGKVIQTIPLSVSSGSLLKFKVKVNSRDITKDAESGTKFVDVILLADRTRKTAADYFFDEVNWGRSRLPLN
jgi:hypothetical protein